MRLNTRLIELFVPMQPLGDRSSLGLEVPKIIAKDCPRQQYLTRQRRRTPRSGVCATTESGIAMNLNRSPSTLAINRNAICLIAACATFTWATAVFGQISSLPEAPAAGPANSSAKNLHPFSSATGTVPPAPWRVVGLPRANKPLTRFDIMAVDGRRVLRVEADRSYANLVHDLPGLTLAPGMQLRWRWRLDQPLRQADLRQRGGDDSPLKVCVLFDLPIEQLGFVERNLLRAGRSASGENLPAATLCYVWDATLAPGTLLRNAFTDRLRMIVLDSGEQRLGQWVAHKQDLTADFFRAFGEESASLPPLIGVLVGADADNTAGHSLGYIGDVTLSP